MAQLALSSQAFNDVQRYIRQRRAGGQTVTPRESRLAWQAFFDVNAARSLESRRLGLQERSLDQRIAESDREFKLREEALEREEDAAKVRGVTELASTAALGAVALKGTSVGAKIGLGSAAPSVTSTAAPAVAAGAAPTSAAAPLAATPAAEAAAASGAAGLAAPATSTSAAAPLTAAVGPGIAAAGAGFIGSEIGEQVIGNDAGEVIGGIAAGAGVGAIIGGPVGAVVGGVVGGVVGAVKAIKD